MDLLTQRSRQNVSAVISSQAIKEYPHPELDEETEIKNEIAEFAIDVTPTIIQYVAIKTEIEDTENPNVVVHETTEIKTEIEDLEIDTASRNIAKETKKKSLEELCIEFEKRKEMFGGKVYECLICYIGFLSPENYEKHRLCHAMISDSGPTCSACDVPFATAQGFIMHCRITHDELASNVSTRSFEDLINWQPPDEDIDHFNNLVEVLNAHFPPGWKTWRVNDLSFFQIFGESLHLEVERKLRFLIPTRKLIQCFDKDTSNISERRFIALKRNLLRWPLGIALIYSPHKIAHQLHPTGENYDMFFDTVKNLKEQLTSRTKASSRLSVSKETEGKSSPSCSESRQTIREEDGQPPIKKSKQEDCLTQLSANQNEMLQQLAEMSKISNNNLKKLKGRLTSRKPCVKSDALEKSDKSVSNTQGQIKGQANDPLQPTLSQNHKAIRGEEGGQPPNKKPKLDANSKQLRAEPNEMLKKLAEMSKISKNNLKKLKGRPTSRKPCVKSDALEKSDKSVSNTLGQTKGQANGPLRPTSSQNHSVETDDWQAPPFELETEPKIGLEITELDNLGIQGQRLESTVKYAGAQKQFLANPVLGQLKTNDILATITPSSNELTLLGKTDETLGTILHGLFIQRQKFLDIYNASPQKTKAVIAKYLLGPNSAFRKISDNLLQYVCGKRAEIIQARRAIYKCKNKGLNELLHNIPPSSTHLFDDAKLSQLVKEQGGVSKVFLSSLNKPAFKPRTEGRNETRKPQPKSPYSGRKNLSK